MFKKKLLNYRPFLFTAVSIALGIGSGYLFYFNSLLLGILVVFIFLFFLCITVFFTGDEIKAKLIFAVAFILIFAFGAGAFYYQVKDFDGANLNGHLYTVSGKVTYANKTDYGQELTLDNVSIEGDRTGKLKYKVELYVYGDGGFDVGDVLQFESSLTDNKATYEQKLSATNIELGIKYSARLDSSLIVNVDYDANIFEQIHLFLRDSIRSGMGENESAVAYGLLLGNTREMETEVITSYRSAGVAHIFAVSGLHIGFLATALGCFFNKIRINKLVKAILITLTLFFYSGVCGFSASSLRASVMCAVVLFSSLRGQRYDGLSSIGLACTLILLCSPINMFCVGFQLSFIVVLGLTLLSPPLARLLSFMPAKLANAVSAVISAQVVGIPICLYAFGSFSTIAIIANLIFIPIIGFIFVLLFVAALAGGLFNISNITLHAHNHLFRWINQIITAIDYKIFIVGGFAFGIFALFYYFALVLPCGLLNFNRLVKVLSSTLCIIACVAGTTVSAVIDKNSAKAYVIGSENVCATVIEEGDENIMIVSDVGRTLSLSRLKRLKNRQGINKIDTLIFTQGDVDIQTFLTRFREVFDLEKVCYFGDTDTVMEEIVRKSFGVQIYSYNQDTLLAVNNFNCYYALDGYAVCCEVKGEKLVVFSEFGTDYSGYKGLTGEYDYIIAVDYTKFIDQEYKPSHTISYRDSLTYKSADNDGTLTLRLK